MRRDEVEARLEAAVSCETFSSWEGRRIAQAAYQALLSLPRGVDEWLVRRAYARYLDEAPQHLWSCVHKVSREHADGLLTELTMSRPCIQRTFLLAATGESHEDLTDDGYERLVEAGEMLAKLIGFQQPALSRASADRVWGYSRNPVLLQAAQTALRAFPLVCDAGGAPALDYLWMVTLLALDGACPSIEVLEVVVDAALDAPQQSLEARERLLDDLARPLRFFLDDTAQLLELIDRLEEG